MELFKLNTRLFSMPNEIKNDTSTLVYCFAHHENNIFNIVDGLKQHSITNIYILQNQTEMSGIDDYKKNSSHYKSFDISTSFIPFSDSTINTKNESDTVIQYALTNNIKKIFICAPTFHILRAAMTIISSAIIINADIKFTVLVPPMENKNWLEKSFTTHQGESNEKSGELLELELDRIYSYINKGDIKPANEIWKYLDKH